MLDKKQIIDLYRGGLSINQIAEKYNTYGQKIRRLLIKANEPLRTKSEAQKNAIEKGTSKHPTEGRKRTDKEKMKISRSTVNYWANVDEDTMEKRREQSRQSWESLSKTKLDEMRKLATEKIREAAKHGSKLEREVQKMLIRHNIPYESHKKNLIPTQKLEIDLYVPEFSSIIEVDGPSHFEPIWGEEQLKKQQKFDAQKMGLILKRGFYIIRIECRANSLSISKLKDLEIELIKTLEEIKNKNSEKIRILKYE